ncbi:hypothetical protein L226DRAFT_82747 [Lentinus tigrinus ALCF2SS1-7]|uniref:uncharacterized protein n=1 Tax=Lentinus tigrinus ALCF2SS1-7 TaxID=1328758 RepID=UPI0011662743|nr:hypothetical protein L226DRAFT_82747 [Lentinus tigrinus ALCF2SS1-7]
MCMPLQAIGLLPRLFSFSILLLHIIPFLLMTSILHCCLLSPLAIAVHSLGYPSLTSTTVFTRQRLSDNASYLATYIMGSLGTLLDADNRVYRNWTAWTAALPPPMFLGAVKLGRNSWQPK